jgi:DNA-binding NarL/FixJ family response regulator
MRVVIAEDSVLLRVGLARVLQDAGLDVVAQVGDADSLLEAVRHVQPDVVTLDVRMPPTQTDEGARAAERIRSEHPAIGILLLSQVVDAGRAIRLFDDGEPRGLGYLLKDRILEIDDFIASVKRVATGGTVVDPEVVAQLIGRRNRQGALDTLTEREREVLALMAEGHSNHAIRDKLVISPRTVETHIANIFEKLALIDSPDHNRRVLAVLAYLRE